MLLFAENIMISRQSKCQFTQNGFHQSQTHVTPYRLISMNIISRRKRRNQCSKPSFQQRIDWALICASCNIALYCHSLFFHLIMCYLHNMYIIDVIKMCKSEARTVNNPFTWNGNSNSFSPLCVDWNSN